MYYSIRHMTRFRYSMPITESVMEVRMHPRTEGNQRCLEFNLQSDPTAYIMQYRDYRGNHVHNFNIPGRHVQMTITTETLVEVTYEAPLPDALDPQAWDILDEMAEGSDYWDMLMPSQFAHPSELLRAFAAEKNVCRRDDPLTVLRELNTIIYNSFEYVPQSTEVDSPIDDALRSRRGVCQDFAHIMIALVRELGIPCRYVSGYLFHRTEDHDRSEEDATHAWLEALLPNLGWVGFDPTNNLIVGERHIRTAIGCDYADVPPTRGVFKGNAQQELDVGVRVAPTQAPIPDDEDLLPAIDWSPPPLEESPQDHQEQDLQREQQQQQQQ